MTDESLRMTDEKAGGADFTDLTDEKAGSAP
jgi:hypothetical protein